MNYSNPRMKATVENWPSGSKRVTAHFSIESVAGRGERACRTTTGATKKLTYAPRVRIVDGDDGKVYIAELTFYGHITIMEGNMKFQHETVHVDSPRHRELKELFK